ncbi:MAG TPA: histidine kinase [Thermoanaerobaculia bacterium]
MTRLIRSAVLIYAVWTAAALFFGSQHALISWTRGFDLPATEQLLTMLVGCNIWALFTPFVIFVAERLPLAPPHTLRNAALLVPFALFVAVLRAPIDVFMPFHAFNSTILGTPLDIFLAQVQIHLLFVLVIIGVTAVTRVEKIAAEQRKQEERFAAALAQARLRRLRADLNPHFLFNALNAAASLLETSPAAAERTIDTLCDLLGRSVATENALEVRLADELEFIERYLHVQKTRFGQRLRTHIGVASLDLLDAAIPPLLIQPLVENAIVHSVARRPEGGWVGVQVAREGGRLCIEILDDGDGFDPGAARTHDSIGVPNARARLQFLYGDDQSLSFERHDGRFIARVQLPLHELETAA